MPALTAASLTEGTYNIDPAHSHIGFSVKHMGIATVRGSFQEFQGVIEIAPPELRITGSAEVKSINTSNDQRDEHLRSSDFFEASAFPQITFTSAGVEFADGEVTLNGDITIKGVTKPITLKGELSENGQDPWGNDRIGIDASGKIDRREFGLEWNQALANNGVLVSNEVKLDLSASAVKA
jgi:polyisoprenoid-binding protein YceI